MIGILKIAGLILFVAVIILLIYAATRPDQFHIVRKVSINAPAEVIYPRISDLRQFNEWNPFTKSDPSINIIYGGTTAGLGGSYDWDSTGQAGKGRMVITDATAPNRVAMSLHFEKPMKANNNVVFTLQPRGLSTDVTWEMTGTYSPLHKIMSVVFNFDKMLGGEFEKGLADLKSQLETR